MVRLLTLKRLFSKVDLASLEQVEASYSGLGPRHYSVKACLCALVLMHLLNVPSETMLAVYLGVHRDVAEACGFNQGFKRRRGTPSQSALNRFKHRVSVEGFERLFEELTRCLLKAGVAKGRWVVVDHQRLTPTSTVTQTHVGAIRMWISPSSGTSSTYLSAASLSCP